MIKLLILADDFTGALDTGVQFSAAGAVTRVMTDPGFDYAAVDDSVDVLVLNLMSRRLPPHEAHELVIACVDAAVKHGVKRFYKKTDSALRGNIGSEIAAMLEATGEKQLHFIPAYPKMHRYTIGGVQYANGAPVAESVFGADYFEPVTLSQVSEIIGLQTGVPVIHLSPGEKSSNKGILVYDAVTLQDIEKSAAMLQQSDGLRVMAGCAGFASVLPDFLELRGKKPEPSKTDGGLLVACGSINPITRAQVNYAEEKGFLRVRLKPRQKLEPAWLDGEDFKSSLKVWRERFEMHENCIIDTNEVHGTKQADAYAKENGMDDDDIRRMIPHVIGSILRALLDAGLRKNLVITGGDTLLGFIRCMGINSLTPICEILEGTVLSKISYNGHSYNLITKSGGFGDKHLLCELVSTLNKTYFMNDFTTTVVK